MSFQIKRVTTDDLTSVVGVMNSSSAGLSFQFDIDSLQFLSLSSFWNLSYKYSYIAYVGSNAAGVILSSIDESAKESYTFYWGVNPRFRRTTLSLKLLMTCLDQLARDGFHRNHGDTSIDSPSSIYLRIGACFQDEMLQMEGFTPSSANMYGAQEHKVEPISLEDFLMAPDRRRPSASPWIYRPTTIRGASAYLHFLKCSDVCIAYQPHSAGCVVIDFKSPHPTGRPIAAILRYLEEMSAGQACKFGYVPANDPLPGLLATFGFTIAKRSTAIALDLDDWRIRRKL